MCQGGPGGGEEDEVHELKSRVNEVTEGSFINPNPLLRVSSPM